jgi:hypothetical protein
MKQSGLHQYDEALHAANVWLKELMEILDRTDARAQRAENCLARNP